MRGYGLVAPSFPRTASRVASLSAELCIGSKGFALKWWCRVGQQRLAAVPSLVCVARPPATAEGVANFFLTPGLGCVSLYRAYDFRGVPLPIVRHLVRQTLVALDYLHTKCNIIHTGTQTAAASVAALHAHARLLCLVRSPLQRMHAVLHLLHALAYKFKPPFTARLHCAADIKPENVVLTETLQPRGQEQEKVRSGPNEDAGQPPPA